MTRIATARDGIAPIGYLRQVDDPYKTLAEGLHRHEIDKIKGSRFIASAGRFSEEATMMRTIATLRDRYPEANHHCWAWRAGQGFRYSDDGEPSGSAGRPLLRQIDGHDLDRIFVVVTRIFGGTKLGVGGLLRAYSSAARELLDRAPVEVVTPTRRVRVRLAYEFSGVLQSIVSERGIEPVESRFTETIEQFFDLPVGDVSAFVKQLRERTAGRAEIEVEG